MEGYSSPLPDSNPSPAGASKYLSNLPSRGLFASTVLSSNPDGMRVYICDHDTSPPEGQLIKTNQANILIRSLMFKKQKADSSLKGVKGTAALEASRKRPAEKALDSRAAAKRTVTNTQIDSRQEASKCRIPEKDFQSLTVERLRVLLKEKGLSLRGKKASIKSTSSALFRNSDAVFDLVPRGRTDCEIKRCERLIVKQDFNFQKRWDGFELLSLSVQH